MGTPFNVLVLNSTLMSTLDVFFTAEEKSLSWNYLLFGNWDQEVNQQISEDQSYGIPHYQHVYQQRQEVEHIPEH